MDSYTTRPETVTWTALTRDEESRVMSSGSFRSESYATTEGNSVFGRTASLSVTTADGTTESFRHGNTSFKRRTTNGRSEDGGTTATHDPPTATYLTTNGTNSTAFTFVSTYTLDYTWFNTFRSGVTEENMEVEADTFEVFSSSISRTTSESYSGGGSGTGSGETTAAHPATTTDRTVSNSTSSSLYTEVDTAYYRFVTDTETVEASKRTTTSSSATITTGPAGTDTTTSRAWGLAVTYDTVTTTVASQAWGEPAHAATYQQLDVGPITTTSLNGTSTRTINRTSYDITKHTFSTEVRDTVFLMPAFQNSANHNQSHVLWKWSRTDMAAGSTYAGPFASFYSSDPASIITMRDFNSWHTSSAAAGTITVSVGTTTYSQSTGTDAEDTGTVTGTTTVTFTNGVWYSSGVPTSERYTITFDDGSEIGTTSISGTYKTGTATDATSSSSTSYFTQATTKSGYETSGVKQWTTATSSSLWGISTSRTSARPSWWSSKNITSRRSHRTTTADSILISIHSTTEGTTTTGPEPGDTGTTGIPVFLGMSSTLMPRAHTFWSTHSTTATSSGYTRSQWISTTSESGDNATTITITSGPDSGSDTSSEAATRTTSSVYGLTIHHDHSASNFTVSRLLPHIISADNQHNASGFARHRVLPEGYAGFHSSGTYQITGAQVYLTTSSGTAAGSDFGGVSLFPPGQAAATENGPTIWPVNPLHTPTLYAEGLASSSLITPSAATFATVSVAATLTSSSTSATSQTSAVTSSRSATYTIGAVLPISGNFFSDESIEFNSVDANIGLHAPYAATGGYGAGDDRSAAHTLFLPNGRASWTTLTGSVGGSSSSSGSNASLSITIPQGAAAVVSCEPVLTAEWRNDEGQQAHYIAGNPYISHDLQTP